MGRAPVRFPVTYRCGCGTHMTLSAHEFNRLPQLAPEEYEHRLPEERIDTPSKSVSQRFIPVKQAKPGLGALVEAPPLKDVKLPMFKEK